MKSDYENRFWRCGLSQNMVQRRRHVNTVFDLRFRTVSSCFWYQQRCWIRKNVSEKKTFFHHLQDLKTESTLTFKWYEFSFSEKPRIFFIIQGMYVFSIWSIHIKLPTDTVYIYIYIHIYRGHTHMDAHTYSHNGWLKNPTWSRKLILNSLESVILIMYKVNYDDSENISAKRKGKYTGPF